MEVFFKLSLQPFSGFNCDNLLPLSLFEAVVFFVRLFVEGDRHVDSGVLDSLDKALSDASKEQARCLDAFLGRLDRLGGWLLRLGFFRVIWVLVSFLLCREWDRLIGNQNQILKLSWNGFGLGKLGLIWLNMSELILNGLLGLG